jgi:ADP-ribose pyrophosphatase YjhB (NUDIX family)
MKRKFAVLLLKAPVDNDASGAASNKLRNLATAHNLTVYTECDLGLAGLTSGQPLNGLDEKLIFLIGGSPDGKLLQDALDVLFNGDRDAIVIVDALDTADSLGGVLHKLAESVQMAVCGEVPSLVRAKRLMMYAYPKADATTTTVVLVDWGTDDAQVLTIEREHEPFKDQESLPGGFLNPHLESLPECSARELDEETHVRPPVDELVLIDVRSRPDRDPRGHIVDHGYAWFVPDDRKDEVLASAAAGDDAKPGTARFVRVSDVLARKVAFDHYDLLVAALARAPKRG